MVIAAYGAGGKGAGPAEGEQEEISTVLVGGFSPDATPRELDNFCRFMSGFQNAKVDMKRGTMLFVRFDTSANAMTAIDLITGQLFDRSRPGEMLRATMARNNMRKDGPGSVANGGWQPPPPGYPPPTGHGPGMWSQSQPSTKRPRITEDPGQIDTVACVGAYEAGMDEHALEGFFASLPGFMTFKHNPRMGGGFAKFENPQTAAQAVVAAKENGVPASMAKSSMGAPPKPDMAHAGQHAYSAGQPAPPAFISPRQPVHVRPLAGGGAGNPQGVDTVACVGAVEAGWDEGSLQTFFSMLPGFVALKPSPKIGGSFVKFGTPQLAAEAIAAAQAEGIPAAPARSSMSSI